MNPNPYYGLSLIPEPYIFENEEEQTRDYFDYFLIRTLSMFEYKGLPETIPAHILEIYLQLNGHVCFFKHEGELYASFGGWGGYPDEYYIPTKYIIANPYLDVFETFTINEDCAIIRSDDLYKGLAPMISKYSTQLANNDTSIAVSNINARVVALIEAPDDRSKVAADRFIENVKRGKLSSVLGNAFLEGIKSVPYSGTSGEVIKTLVELHQYIKGSFFNDLGLQANYNMKREALSESEIGINDDALIPLIENMLKCRREGLEKVNELFGTDITVDFSSVWKKNELENDIELVNMATDAFDETSEPEPVTTTENEIEEELEPETEQEQEQEPETDENPISDLVETIAEEVINEIEDEENPTFEESNSNTTD